MKTKIMIYLLALFVLTVSLSTLKAEIPCGYYDKAEGLKGEALKKTLHHIIKGHKTYSYKEMWDILRYTDQDPDNPDNVIFFYTGWSKSRYDNGGGASQWNREHVWAKSHGQFGTRQGAGTDAHHLRPADVSVNSKRSNLDFDEGGELYTDPDGPTACRVDRDSWEPRDAVKGDVARMLFYMAVRYEGDPAKREPDLELNDRVDNGSTPQHGKLSVLLEWHKKDPVDDWERRRNDRVYEKQGNRNPFIDHPEYVAYIWENNTPTTPPPPETRGIIITEIAANPGGSYHNEYIELYNSSGQIIDIANWELIIHRRNHSTITVKIGAAGTRGGTTAIAPGGFYVITRGTVAYQNKTMYSGLYLNRCLYIELKNGNTIMDSAGTTNDCFSPSTNYELSSTSSDNSTTAAWINKGEQYPGTAGKGEQ